MQFELQLSLFDNGVPDLVIPVSEVLKAKNYLSDERAWQERKLFNECLSIYSYYCGAQVVLLSRDFSSFCNSIGKTGKVVFSCVRTEDGPEYLCRVLSNEGERVINCNFSFQIHR